MIAVDTNVVVRLVTADDQTQFRRARKAFRDHEVFLAETVLLETEWVLRYSYGFDADRIVGALRGLLGMRNVHVKDGAWPVPWTGTSRVWILPMLCIWRAVRTGTRS